MKCQDCDEDVKELYPDPRDPPLDDMPCLCGGCLGNAVDEKIAELQDEIATLQEIKQEVLKEG